MYEYASPQEEDKHFFEFKHMFLGDGPAAEINDLMMREMAKR